MSNKKERKPRKPRKPRTAQRRATQKTYSSGGLEIPISVSVSRQNDVEGLDEDASYELARSMHPELEKLELAGRLPEEVQDEAGNVWSPRLHIDLHTVVENQLASGEPAGIVEIALELEADGKLGPHEVRHVIMDSLAGQIFEIQQSNTTFNAEIYLRGIKTAYQKFCNAKFG